MDPVSAFALQVVLASAFLYGLYWVVRKAVAAGRLDAQRKTEEHGAAQPNLARSPRS